MNSQFIMDCNGRRRRRRGRRKGRGEEQKEEWWRREIIKTIYINISVNFLSFRLFSRIDN